MLGMRHLIPEFHEVCVFRQLMHFRCIIYFTSLSEGFYVSKLSARWPPQFTISLPTGLNLCAGDLCLQLTISKPSCALRSNCRLGQPLHKNLLLRSQFVHLLELRAKKRLTANKIALLDFVPRSFDTVLMYRHWIPTVVSGNKNKAKFWHFVSNRKITIRRHRNYRSGGMEID